MKTNQITGVVRLPDIINLTGASKATIYSWMSQNRFPKPIKIGSRSVAWIAEEVNAWIRERINARDEQAGGAK